MRSLRSSSSSTTSKSESVSTVCECVSRCSASVFSSNQKLTLAQQQLQTDYEKLKAEEAEKSHKLQELMSVDNLDCKRSFPCSDNKSSRPDPQSRTSICNKWEQFMPYKNETGSAPKSNKKKQKDAINNLTKQLKRYPASIFHIHTFHFHLIISLTLLFVTHKCPSYLIVV